MSVLCHRSLHRGEETAHAGALDGVHVTWLPYQGNQEEGCTQTCLLWYPAGRYKMGQGYRHM